VVNIPAWDAKITELLGSEQVNKGLVDLMMEVRHQLSEGADSHVSSPGTTLTQGTNWISEEARADKAYAKFHQVRTHSGSFARPRLHPVQSEPYPSSEKAWGACPSSGKP